MSSHTLKLHIENPGTLYSSPNGEMNRSLAGHAWFEVTYSDGSSVQSGFAPQDPKSGTSSVPGNVFRNDGKNYAGAPAFTAQYEITAAQAKTLEQFHENPAQFGFDKDNYHALTNSCVDFVWKALETIGMNPLKKQGDVLPIDNIDDFMRLKNPAIRPKPSAPISVLGDAWDSLRTPDVFPMLPWEIAFEPEAPQGTITVGPLGPAIPVVPTEMDFGTPPPQGSVSVAPLGVPEPVPAPTWEGWAYGDCLVLDDPTPGVDRGDHSLCKLFYAPSAFNSANPSLSRMTVNGLVSSGRNEFSMPWLA
jgi:hypothetical protein